MNRQGRLEELNDEIAVARNKMLTLQAERDALEVNVAPSFRKHPLQKITKDKHDILRFVENKIVIFLLDNGGHDLNSLACRGFSNEDFEQFAQLIGYSVDGFGSLSYVSDEAVAEADAIVALLADSPEKQMTR